MRYPRLVPKDAECAKQLKRRTLTNLYNERPTWLALAHDKLDAAVFAAYAWPPSLTNDELLEDLLALNLDRAVAEDAHAPGVGARSANSPRGPAPTRCLDVLTGASRVGWAPRRKPFRANGLRCRSLGEALPDFLAI